MPARPSNLLGCVLLVLSLLAGTCIAAQTAPVAPTALAAKADDGKAVLTWSGPSDAAAYNVYQSQSSSITTASPKIGSPTAATLSVTGLTNGTTYYWIVTAVNAAGVESPASPVASTTPTQAGSQTSTSASPTISTNLGTSSNTKKIDKTLTVDPILVSQFPATLSRDDGTLLWQNDVTYKLIQNACNPGNHAPDTTVSLPDFDSPSTFTLIHVTCPLMCFPATMANHANVS